MLGKTADALSAFMGAAVLAEVGDTDGAQWVIVGRALDAQKPAPDGVVHVQIGGPGAQVLGQSGGLDTSASSYDCAFLWAIEISDDEFERFVRLDPNGEVFDAAPELEMLLPFSLQEPELPVEPEQPLEDDDEPTDSLDLLDPDHDDPSATRH